MDATAVTLAIFQILNAELPQRTRIGLGASSSAQANVHFRRPSIGLAANRDNHDLVVGEIEANGFIARDLRGYAPVHEELLKLAFDLAV